MFDYVKCIYMPREFNYPQTIWHVLKVNFSFSKERQKIMDSNIKIQTSQSDFTAEAIPQLL